MKLMKRKIALFGCLIIGLVIVSCSTTGLITDSSGGRDGSSYDKAVIAYSVRAEYKWIDKTYPESDLMTQVVTQYNGKVYDVVSIRTKEGTEKSVYFDITRFYRSKEYTAEENN